MVNLPIPLQPWNFAGDRFLALYGWSNTDIRICDLRSGRLYASLKGTVGYKIESTSFRSDSTQVVVWDIDWIELWDLGSHTRRVWKSEASAWNVAFSPQNDLVAWVEGSGFGLLDAISGEKVVPPGQEWDENTLHGLLTGYGC